MSDGEPFSSENVADGEHVADDEPWDPLQRGLLSVSLL
jgi:hypothetical protein